MKSKEYDKLKQENVSRLNNRELGSIGENIAVEYLIKNGHSIIFRNYRNKFGEIDIISMEDSTIVFTEVKYRSNELFGSPFEAIGYKKQDKIKCVALEFLSRNGHTGDIRFDCIGIVGEEIEWIKNAFS